jgi:hypothetical protein
MRKFIIITALCGFVLSMVTSADAARRARGPLVIITDVGEIVSHN